MKLFKKKIVLILDYNPALELPGVVQMFFSFRSIKSYPDVAHAVLVSDQLTGFFVWFQNGSEFSIPCHVEAVISSQHQQPSAVSPTDLILCTGNTFTSFTNMI